MSSLHLESASRCVEAFSVVYPNRRLIDAHCLSPHARPPAGTPLDERRGGGGCYKQLFHPVRRDNGLVANEALVLVIDINCRLVGLASIRPLALASASSALLHFTRVFFAFFWLTGYRCQLLLLSWKLYTGPDSTYFSLWNTKFHFVFSFSIFMHHSFCGNFN